MPEDEEEVEVMVGGGMQLTYLKIWLKKLLLVVVIFVSLTGGFKCPHHVQPLLVGGARSLGRRVPPTRRDQLSSHPLTHKRNEHRSKQS